MASMLILSKQKFGPKKSNQSLLCCYILTVFISIWIFPIDHLLPHILPCLQGQNLAHGDLSLEKKKKKKIVSLPAQSCSQHKRQAYLHT